MANIALTTAGRVSLVEAIGHGRQRTLPALVAITAGQAVKIDPTTGKLNLANGTDAAHARVYGVALRSVVAGDGLTVIRVGTMDGYAVSGMAFDAPVYLSDTDGTLADAPGTVSVIVGRIVPATATGLGVAYDRLVEINL